VNRLQDLEARRQELLLRCEAQRLELAYHLAQAGPAGRWNALKRRIGPQSVASHPLAWIASIIGLLMMMRTRKVLSGVTWIGGLIALASRATTLLRLFAQIRALLQNVKAQRR